MPLQYYNYNIVKIADESNSTSTLAPDTYLNFQMLSNTAYNIEIILCITVTGTLPVYQWSLSGPTSPNKVTAKNELMLLGATSVTISSQTSYAPVNSTVALTSGSAILKINAIIFNGANSGTFALNFACGAGTSVTNAAGSYLRYTYGLLT